MDQTSIAEGIGGTEIGVTADVGGNPTYGLVNVRQKYIQGVGYAGPVDATANFTGGAEFGLIGDQSAVSGVSGTTVTRRYQINFALGLFNQVMVSILFVG